MSKDPWWDRAACVGQPLHIFFPRRGDRNTADEAKKVCASCPVATDCLAFALSREQGTATSGRFGIYGGVTASDRRRLTRRTA